MKEKRRNENKKMIDRLPNYYIIPQLKKSGFVDTPQDIINVKRDLIKLNREIKKKA